jgi:hypothetical protein
MNAHLPLGHVHDRHEAQNETVSFRFRHHQVNERLGVLRWRGIQEYRRQLLELLDEGGLIVDLGGAAGPLGMGTTIVDHANVDRYGRSVPHSDISEVPKKPHGIFSSHCLEHVDDIEGLMRAIATALEPGGWFLAHVPSFSCERWRAGLHAHRTYGDHLWTFGLSAELPVAGLVNYRDIRQTVSPWLRVTSAEYCGDDSIVVIARNESA